MTTPKMPSVRDRVSGSVGPAVVQYRWGNDVQSPNPAYTIMSAPNRLGWRKDMTDIVTPDFRAWQARGGVINNPMWSTEVEYTGSDKGWSFEAPVPGNRYFGDCPSNWCIYAYGRPEPWVSADSTVHNLVQTTATQAWANVNVGEFQGLAALGELHQTLNLLGDPIRTISDFLWQRVWADADWKAARGKKAKNKALAQLLSSLWLQYQYAFRPILMDIEAIAAELHDQTFSIRRTSRASAQKTITATRSYTSAYGGVSVDFTEEQRTVVSVRSGVLYEAAIDPHRQFGLHWTNLPSALWELTPWSFVADWFINVGDYLQAVVPKNAAILAEFSSIVVKTTVERKSGAARVSSGAPWVTKRSPNGMDRTVRTSKTRRNVLPSPSVTPALSFADSLAKGNRGLNAYMLFLQQFIKGH